MQVKVVNTIERWAVKAVSAAEIYLRRNAGYKADTSKQETYRLGESGASFSSICCPTLYI